MRDQSTDLTRVYAFSDGVFAIAITLLALDLLPAVTGTEESLAALFAAAGPRLLSYAISFLVIGKFWMNHHRIFEPIDRYDRRLVSLNVVVLMLVAVVPFPTALLGDDPTHVAVTFYAVVMILATLSLGGLWFYAWIVRGLGTRAPNRRERRYYGFRFFFPSLVFAFSIPLSAVWVTGAILSWILVAASRPLADRLFPVSMGDDAPL